MIKMFVDQNTKTDPDQTLVLFAHDLLDIPESWTIGRSLLEEEMPDYVELNQIQRDIADRGYAVAYRRHLHIKGTMKNKAIWFFPGDPLPSQTAPEYW